MILDEIFRYKPISNTVVMISKDRHLYVILGSHLEGPYIEVGKSVVIWDHK